MRKKKGSRCDYCANGYEHVSRADKIVGWYTLDEDLCEKHLSQELERRAERAKEEGHGSEEQPTMGDEYADEEEDERDMA